MIKLSKLTFVYKKYFQKSINLEMLIIVLVPIILSAIWFRNGNLLGHGESGIPFYDLGITYRGAKFAWFFSHLGTSSNFFTASIPTYWFLYQLARLGIENVALEAFVFISLFITSGFSIYLFILELFPKIRRHYALLGTFIYWFNPISTINVWNRFLYNHMYIWALLPLVLYLFIRGIRRKDYRFSLITSLSTAIFSYALTTPTFNILLWAMLVYIFIFYFLLKRDLRSFLLKYLGIALVSYLLFNFWWLIQAFYLYFFNKNVSLSSEYFTLEGNISTFNALSQQLGLLVNTLRLLHGTLIYYGPSWMRIYNFPPLVLFEFVITGVVFVTLHIYRKSKEVLFLGILLILSLILIKGSEPPFGVIFSNLFINSSFFQLFRNPFEKFGFILALTLSPLLIFALQNVENSFGNVKNKYRFTIAAFLSLILLWGFPYWTGLVFTYSKNIAETKLSDFELKVPEDYKKANDWLNKQEGVFRFVSLPIKEEGITYTWEKQYSGMDPSTVLFDVPNVSYNTTIPFYNDIVYEISRLQSSDQILDLMPLINGKYILLRKDILFKERGMADPQNLEVKLEEMEVKGDVIEKFNTEKIKIYEVQSKWQQEKIYISPYILTGNVSEIAPFLYLDSDYLENNPALINFEEDLELDNYKEFVFPKPNQLFSPGEMSQIQDFTDGDLLAKLFYVNRLPTYNYYFLVRMKEYLMNPPINDYYGQAIYKTGLLGKRAVEVYKLRQENVDEKIIYRAEKEYVEKVTSLEPLFYKYLKNNTPVSDLIRKSLMYQWLLLQRSQSESCDALSNVLARLKIKPEYFLPNSSVGEYLVYRFEVASSGDFVLNLLNRKFQNEDKMYINGNEIAVSPGENNLPISLDKGLHELAISMDNSSFYENTLDIGDADNTNLDDKEWNIPLSGDPEEYRIEFEYRFSKGREFVLSFTQDIDAVKSPVFLDHIKKSETYHDWSRWTGSFSSTSGAREGVLKITPGQREECFREWWGRKVCSLESSDFDVEIRNFKIKMFTPPKMFISSGSNISDLKGSDIQWKMLNPTLYQVSIDKKQNMQEILVFSELFDNGWKATLDDGSIIPENKHLLTNIYANGWIIEKAGNYTITISYFPQKLLTVGKKISLLSILACGILLGVSILKKRKEN